jgi:predicted HicB family RNase H-like nuclease
MSKRFDAGNLLRADAFVAKADAPTALPSPRDVKAFAEEMLAVRVPVRLKKSVQIAAVERGETLRTLVIEALHAAGFRE